MSTARDGGIGWILGAGAVLAALIFVAMYHEGQSNIRFENECKARRGGVAVYGRGLRQCMDPKAFR